MLQHFWVESLLGAVCAFETEFRQSDLDESVDSCEVWTHVAALDVGAFAVFANDALALCALNHVLRELATH